MDVARSCTGRHKEKGPRTVMPALLVAAVLLAGLAGRSSADDEPFTFVEVVARAKDLAAKPYVDPAGNVPDFLLRLTYDQWRDIRFKESKTLWREEKLPFEVQFFHPGLYYNRTVAINTFGGEGVKTVPFSPDFFDYGANLIAKKIPADFGFAGFRLLYDLNNSADHLDEIAAFLGASYFRAVARDQVYGLSARGLALDTGLESGEEFPYFKEFWLQEPGAEARELLIYALLDSKRITGAYRFSIRPGEKTDMVIEGKLFRREEIKKIGIAPLTSMFFYAEDTNRRPVDDFRPEIHDSDGLLVKSPGEVIWRPIINPQHLFINSFQLSDLAGFGLLQRDTDFDHYQDQETRYDLRPSAVVTPVGNWGAGHVELVQIPSENETNDNIVAYWLADRLPPLDEPITFSYVLSWCSPSEPTDGLGRVVATRSASAKGDSRKIVVDFKGGKLDDLPAQLPSEAPVEAAISTGERGEIVDHQLFRVKPTGCWRLVFRVRRSGSGSLAESLDLPILNRQPVEVRAYLTQGKVRLTETWSYAVWP